VRIVVAVGGNALIKAGQAGTWPEQLANVREIAEAVLALRSQGHEVVLTHGNGPHVGALLLQQALGSEEAAPLPLDALIAMTQGQIGYLLESAFSALDPRVPTAVLLTRVLVDPSDEAFANPTKPVGPFYSEERARELERDRGWQVVHDAGRGWRRVVPSPRPLEVVELDAIRALLRSGAIVVACGGGGIPAARRGAHLAGLDAVIDKDRASALLARELEADRFVILTEVPAVYRSFGTDAQEELRTLSAAEAETLVPELAAGSMRPKVEACLDFARTTGNEALITSPAALAGALAGDSGTRITS
jgi:carbamate kinase